MTILGRTIAAVCMNTNRMMERDCSYLTRSAPDAADKYSELAAGENDPMPMWGQN